MCIHAAVLALLFAAVAPLHATLAIHPHAPTSADVITLRSQQICTIDSDTVSRAGDDITVVLGPSALCGTPPLPKVHETSLGKLPPGRYRVEVSATSAGATTLDFVVRDATPALAVHPSVIVANAAGQRLWLEATQRFSLCGNATSCSPVVEIGGVSVQAEAGGPGLTALLAPPLTPGWKDLRITTTEGTFTFPVALYVHAPGSEPDVYAFERILFPVLFSSDGVNGSSWVSEAVIFNPTRYAIANANELAPGTGSLAPRSRKELDGEGHVHGVALLVPRAEAENVAFSLRVRDISRVAEGLGTEVPVVRESDMFREPATDPLTGSTRAGRIERNGDVALLDVPRDARYRTKVRMYAFVVDEVEIDGNDPVLHVVKPDGTTVEEIPVHFSPSCAGAECPLYAEVDLQPQSEGERADLFLHLREGWLTWAFASVTNNETQQVTIVSPNGKGGSRWE